MTEQSKNRKQYIYKRISAMRTSSRRTKSKLYQIYLFLNKVGLVSIIEEISNYILQYW